jgi:hypothetical protein
MGEQAGSGSRKMTSETSGKATGVTIKEILAELTSFLDIGKQLLSVSESIIKIIESYWALSDKKSERDSIDDLKTFLKEIRQRLFTRYVLIEDVRKFAEQGNDKEFNKLKKRLEDRINYLQGFNKTVPQRLTDTNPETASTLYKLAKHSVELYKRLINQKHLDSARIIAGSLVITMEATASQLRMIDQWIDTKT